MAGPIAMQPNLQDMGWVCFSHKKAKAYLSILGSYTLLLLLLESL